MEWIIVAFRCVSSNYSGPLSERFVFGPAERIRQTLTQIEPMLGVPEQAIGPIVERKFENRRGVACRRLIIKRKMCGVSARTISELF
jgi:hypothetical protein